MIATVAFLAAEGMFEGALMSDMCAAAVCEGTQEIFLWPQARFKCVKFVCGIWCRSEEGLEEVE